MKPAKIVLLEPQFSGYSGMLCGVQFENGVSVAELPLSISKGFVPQCGHQQSRAKIFLRLPHTVIVAS